VIADAKHVGKALLSYALGAAVVHWVQAPVAVTQVVGGAAVLVAALGVGASAHTALLWLEAQARRVDQAADLRLARAVQEELDRLGYKRTGG